MPPGQYGMPPAGPAMYGPPPAAPQQQPTTYVVQGGFDAGARFDGVSQPNIPVSICVWMNHWNGGMWISQQ